MGRAGSSQAVREGLPGPLLSLCLHMAALCLPPGPNLPCKTLVVFLYTFMGTAWQFSVHVQCIMNKFVSFTLISISLSI